MKEWREHASKTYGSLAILADKNAEELSEDLSALIFKSTIKYA